MFPQPMSRPELHPDDSPPDPAFTLEEHIAAGFPPDLALDLVLNELVVRAAKATRANAAALALVRGDEMVCRAATGHLAPDLGVPINSRDGLSGACFQTRQPQLSVDTEFDPRVDLVISHRLGIRSILIVPVFDANRDASRAQFAGILEIFSSSPAIFSHADQKRLEGFAEECARIRQASAEITQRKPDAVFFGPIVPSEVAPPDSSATGAAPPNAEAVPPNVVVPNVAKADAVQPQVATLDVVAAEVVPAEFTPSHLISPTPPASHRPSSELWTLALAALVILATIGFSFLVGSRLGWLFPAKTASSSRTQTSGSAGQNSAIAEPSPKTNVLLSGRLKETASGKAGSAPPTPVASRDELVVYEKGKVIFRMKPAPPRPSPESGSEQAVEKARPPHPDVRQQDTSSIVEASSTKKIAVTPSVWLAPAQAESRLLARTEPDYPAAARAAHRAGNVVLEIQVAEDGSVSSARPLSGDPVLATAAAEAVRNWRYQPYRHHDRAAQFQTDVTLSFSLPH